MLDDPDDDITEFEDDFGQATVFDPTPWGARQRVLPRETFLPGGGVVASRARPVSPTPPPPPPPAPVMPAFSVRAVAVPLVAAIPSLPQAWFPQPQPAWSTQPARPRPAGERKLRTMAARYAAPLFGVCAMVAFLIAYVAKPSSHARASVATSLTAAAAPSVSAGFTAAPTVASPEAVVLPPAPPVEVAPIVEPITEPVIEPEPVAEPVVATAEPIVSPVVHEPRPHRAIAKSPARRTAKAALVTRVSKRRPIKLDALDTATPLGRMRPGKLH